jgi:hypothetical protein
LTLLKAHVLSTDEFGIQTAVGTIFLPHTLKFQNRSV